MMLKGFLKPLNEYELCCV